MFRRLKALFGGSGEDGTGPPVTLIQRILRTEGGDERRLLKLAAESEARGHAPQAIEALRKLEQHYARAGVPAKRVAVLARISGLAPNDVEVLAELEEAHRAAGHPGDADRVAHRRTELLRRAGQLPDEPVAHRPRAEVVRVAKPAIPERAEEDEVKASPDSGEDDTLPSPGLRRVLAVPEAPTTIDTHPPGATAAPKPTVTTPNEDRTKPMDSGALDLLRRLTKR